MLIIIIIIIDGNHNTNSRLKPSWQQRVDRNRRMAQFDLRPADSCSFQIKSKGSLFLERKFIYHTS